MAIQQAIEQTFLMQAEVLEAGGLLPQTLLTLWASAAEVGPINARGWTVLTISVGTVLMLVGYCLYRVLTLPPVEIGDLHGPLDIDTRDRVDMD